LVSKVLRSLSSDCAARAPTEALHGLIHQAAHLGFVAHIGMQGLGLHALRAQFSGQRLAGFVSAARVKAFADHVAAVSKTSKS
jgi:hypothetical protein